MAKTSTLRPGGECEMALYRPQDLSGSMSQLGQKRRFDRSASHFRSTPNNGRHQTDPA